MYCCIGLLFFVSFTVSSKADTLEPYTITIVKYKLSTSQLQQGTLPNSPTDSLLTGEEIGGELERMPDVSYRITEVTPSVTVPGVFDDVADFVPQTITTDTLGTATISLQKGYYRVTELGSDQIVQPAEPVIVQLPMRSGDRIIDHVFIYPKSSVVTPSTENPPGNEVPTTPTTEGRLPNTAAMVSMSKTTLYVLIGLLSVSFIAGSVLLHKRAK